MLDNDIDEDCDGIAQQTQSSTVDLIGRIVDIRGNPINRVVIDGGNDALRTRTDMEGRFRINNVDTSISMNFMISKDDDLSNGVTSLDIITALNHILDRNPLSDENLIRAADLNGDGRVSSLDLVFMTNIILGREVNITRERSWIFNPEILNSAVLQDFENIELTGYKLGDLNGDADPSR